MRRVVLKTRLISLALAASALALLSGCGGGTTQIQPFAPTRIISFGDESSLVQADGTKYTVNAFKVNTKDLDCRLNPMWTQAVAAQFGLVFPQCNPDAVASPKGIMYAAVGAKVADVTSRIDAHLASDSFGAKDLVTVLVGMNDVLELYSQFPTKSRDALINEAKARGAALGDQVNRIAGAGGRVLISTIYDMGLTPFALNEKLNKPDIDRAVFLDDLSSAFNVAMRLKLVNDGRLIGLVLTDETIQQAARFPALTGYTDVTHAACKAEVAAPACTADTLVTNGSPTTWLWATDTLLSPQGQSRIGSVARQRAVNNPF